MKKIIVCVIAGCGLVLGGDNSPNISVKHVQNMQQSTTDKITIEIKLDDNGKEVPKLNLEFSRGMQTRIAFARYKEGQLQVVIQFDEFYLQFREFKLENMSWSMASDTRICNLNGPLARSLRKVDISEIGEVILTFNDTIRTQRGNISWEHDLLQPEVAIEGKCFVEKYILGDSHQWRLQGMPHRYRPATGNP